MTEMKPLIVVNDAKLMFPLPPTLLLVKTKAPVHDVTRSNTIDEMAVTVMRLTPPTAVSTGNPVLIQLAPITKLILNCPLTAVSSGNDADENAHCEI